MTNRPRALHVVSSLLIIIIAASWYKATDLAAVASGTIPDGVTHVAIYAYDDANGNGWRDAAEAPFLPPFDLIRTQTYGFISTDCDNDIVGWILLAEGAENVVALRRGCEYDTLSRPFDDDNGTPVYVGTFFTGSAEMTIYVPQLGTPDNLLGTPTPGGPTTAPSPTQTPTNQPANVLTPTPTGTRPAVDTPESSPIVVATATPTGTRPVGLRTERIFLPLVQAD